MNRLVPLLLALLSAAAPTASRGDQVLQPTSTTLHDPARPGSSSWSESFPTNPGAVYQVYFVLSQSSPTASQNVETIVNSGEATPVDTVFTAPESESAVHTATFVASDTTATLTFNDLAASPSSSVTTLAAISVASLPAYEHPGHYEGSVVEKRSFPGSTSVETITSSEVRSVNVRINYAGQMFYLFEPGDEYEVGTINNDASATYDDSDAIRGESSYKSGILQLSFSFSVTLGNNFNGVQMIRTRSFTLRRVGD